MTVVLFHVIDHSITEPSASVMGFAFHQYSGQIIAETDEGIRLGFPNRVCADAFKRVAIAVGQTVVELQ